MKEVKNDNRTNTNVIYYFLLIFWILFLSPYIWTVLYWSWFNRIFISIILLPVYFFWIKWIYDIIKWKIKANNLKKLWILKKANIIEIKSTGHSIISKQKSYNSYKYILKEWNNIYETENIYINDLKKEGRVGDILSVYVDRDNPSNYRCDFDSLEKQQNKNTAKVDKEENSYDDKELEETLEKVKQDMINKPSLKAWFAVFAPYIFFTIFWILLLYVSWVFDEILKIKELWINDYITTALENWNFMIFIFALVPLYFSIYWITWIYNSYKRNYLIDNWIRILAKVIEIKKSKFSNSLYIVASDWNNIYESEKSRYIINKPWDSIPVYIDNNNSKKYWVDTTLSYHWFLYARELMKWKAKESVSLINNSK